jgi:ubiquinone/menaquinone biosynthesis C-methylase UbiE
VAAKSGCASNMSLRGTMTSKPAEPPLAPVYDFWNFEACGSHYVRAKRGTPEFYEEYRQLRYDVEWHIPLLVPFAETKGKKVLEIGCGNGADGVMFALAGADYTGVDLTNAAIEATRTHFDVLGLKGRFQIENAESLSFADESFDFVYSHGVLHHTSSPENAFAEVHRVLKTGGNALLMLYHKRSFNYYVRILGYMRGRVLLRILTRMGRHAADRSALAEKMINIRGNANDSVWQIHYENFLRHGWSYLRSENFVHHATDGPECPVAHVYTAKGLRDTFKQFRSIQFKTAHFPLRKYAFAKWAPPSLERWLASKLGWYLFVYLKK